MKSEGPDKHASAGAGSRPPLYSRCLQGVEGGLRRLLADLLDPHTALLKATYFTLFAGVVILWVQLGPFQSSLGLTVADTGVISIVGSVMIIVGPVTSGFLGDVIGNYRFLVAGTSFLNGVVSLGFTLLHAPPLPVEAAPHNLSEGGNSSHGGPLPAEGVSTGSNIFWCYLTLHACFMALNSATISLFDSAVLCSVQRRGIDYGFQRAYGTAAALISASLGGLFVDTLSQGLVTKDYRVIFYVSSGLMIVSALLLVMLDMSYKRPVEIKSGNFRALFTRPALLALFATTLVGGVFVGHAEAFMYRYLSGLGASSLLLGATVTVGGCAELLLMLFATAIVAATGVYPVMAVSFACFTIRFIGLYLLYAPEVALVLELFDSVCSGLFFTVAVMHLTTLVPCDSLASFRGMLGTAYLGIGKLVGATVGTALVGALGTRPAWAVMGALSFTVCGVVILALALRRGAAAASAAAPHKTNANHQPKVTEKGDESVNDTAKHRGKSDGHDNAAFTTDTGATGPPTPVHGDPALHRRRTHLDPPPAGRS